MEVRILTKESVISYIEKKLKENEEYIRYTFYELRVKNNLTEKETQEFLEIHKNYYINKGYKVYETGDKFIYQNSSRKVEDNEYMIAIKEQKEVESNNETNRKMHRKRNKTIK